MYWNLKSNKFVLYNLYTHITHTKIDIFVIVKSIYLYIFKAFFRSILSYLHKIVFTHLIN